MTNISTTNLPSGVTNAQLNVTLSTYGGMDPTVFHQYFNDFDTYAAGDWTVKDADSGSVGLVAGDGGILALVSGATANDFASIQLSVASVALIGGNQFWFKTRINIADVTNSVLILGLCDATATPFSAITDGVWISKAATAAAMTGNVSKSSTASTVALGNLTASTYTTLGFWYDGYQTVNFYVNGNPAGSTNIANLPSANLCVTLGVQAGTSAAQTLDVDYVFAATERPASAST